MYYESLCKKLSENKTNEACLSSIINPFSLYYLCDHYYGNECKVYNIPIPKEKNDLLSNNNIASIKEYDIVHCEVNFFTDFCTKILNKIDTKFILTTGQWNLPQIQKNELTEMIRHHKNVILWISQNPIYENSNSYLAFPYGIVHYNIEHYAKILLDMPSITKMKEIIYLPINNLTNISRRKLPVISTIPAEEYYKKLAESKFIISPIGDRDDTYRHYEAIGLGAIPISNVHNLYENIFHKNMIYATIDDMVHMLSNNSCNLYYDPPNRDLICFEYYKNIVHNHIANLK